MIGIHIIVLIKSINYVNPQKILQAIIILILIIQNIILKKRQKMITVIIQMCMVFHYQLLLLHIP